MSKFILVHGVDMSNILLNIDDISYIVEDEGAANIFTRSRCGEDVAIICHETLKEVYYLIEEELEG